MANQLADNPLELDTAAATVLLNFHVRIGAIVWKGYSNAAHSAKLTDKNGNVIFETVKGYADLTPYSDYIGAWVNGLICPTLGSGKVLVFLE